MLRDVVSDVTSNNRIKVWGDSPDTKSICLMVGHGVVFFIHQHMQFGSRVVYIIFSHDCANHYDDTSINTKSYTMDRVNHRIVSMFPLLHKRQDAKGMLSQRWHYEWMTKSSVRHPCSPLTTYINTLTWHNGLFRTHTLDLKGVTRHLNTIHSNSEHYFLPVY